MIKRNYRLLLVVVSCLLFCGCAVSTTNFTVDVPKVKTDGIYKGKVFIREVKDSRSDLAGTNIIGHKTATGGGAPVIMAPGSFVLTSAGGPYKAAPIVLKNFKNVGEYMKKNIENDFRAEGYRIVDKDDKKAMPVDIIINSCLVGSSVGMKMKLGSYISIYLIVDGEKIHISSGQRKEYHIATDAKYEKVFVDAVESFNEKCREHIRKI